MCKQKKHLDFSRTFQTVQGHPRNAGNFKDYPDVIMIHLKVEYRS